MKKLNLDSLDDHKIKIIEVPWKDIAIIGIAGRFAQAQNLAEFWEILRNGKDCIREFPKARRGNIEDYLASRNYFQMGYSFEESGFMDEIDKFDYDLFGLAPKEAAAMDPNQRLFLETAWQAIEDAGYGGKKLKGSQTGVYMGYSTDFGHEYKAFIHQVDPAIEAVSLAGNIHSIIASRIAYMLDLKGPSLLVDTACSSALAAVYLACQGIRNGDCDMAIAGSVKIELLPVCKIQKTDVDMGIRSATNRTRTFDDASDGPGAGEGVGAVILKKLDQALEDGDHIYAVIKGGAINQDGSSVGITAPNPAAQEALICQAWRNSGIDPETITYIEAHGTGTKLGDPIEINGIVRAFGRVTKKKQFCAIGSVKSNLGHLDNAAGIAGLVKLILMLNHQEIPPTLHFQRPNRKINFPEAPVYVNDRLSKWESNGIPRRCGVSAFGLSGTNCHIVLEEAPERRKSPIENQRGRYLLALSAQYREGVIELAKGYQEFLRQQLQPNLTDLCITANTGRGHYSHRLIMIFSDAVDLLCKLEGLVTAESLGSVSMKDVYYGWHKITAGNPEDRAAGERSENEIRTLTHSLNIKLKDPVIDGDHAYENLLQEICIGYIQGVDVDWEEVYRDKKYHKLSLPTYPFQKKKCWVDFAAGRGAEIGKELAHPFLDKRLTETIYGEIYSTRFSVARYWVLGEHLVNGHHLPPGTVFLEMAYEIGRQYFPGQTLEFKEVVFLNPLVVNKDTDKDVQTIIRTQEDSGAQALGFEFTVASRVNKQWIKHAEGKVYPIGTSPIPRLNIFDLKQNCREKLLNRTRPREYAYDTNNKIELGSHWNVIRDIYYGQNEIVAYLEIPEEYQQDLRQYNMHPSLMDCAVNVAIRMIGEGLYLPWTYGHLKIHGKMPGRFYSYLRSKNQGQENSRAREVATFDIALLDEEGKVFIEITDYLIKKVHEADLRLNQLTDENNNFYHVTWVPWDLQPQEIPQKQGAVLVLKGQTEWAAKIIAALKKSQSREIIQVDLGEEYCRIDDHNYTINHNEESYTKLLADLKERHLVQIIHLQTLGTPKEFENIPQFAESQQKGLYSLYYLTRAILSNRIKEELDIVLISDTVHEVTGAEETLNPHQASFFGLGKVVTQEYPKLHCRRLDIDHNTGMDQLLLELTYGLGDYQIALRDGRRFMEEFQELNLDSLPSQEIPIHSEGVYLITGGTGGIGLEFGKYLAAMNTRAPVKLALFSGTGLPDRKMWDEIIAKNVDQRLMKKIMAIREMEQAGAEVNCYSIDVSNEDDVKRALNELRQRYGKINGVIHAAGVAGDGFIINKETEVFQRVLAPKIRGTWLLDKHTEKDNLDFFIMFSSITSLLGGAGQGDYTAANAFLDAYASYRNKQGKKTLTINWPAWKGTGMAVDYGVNQDRAFRTITTQEALSGFERALHRPVHNVLIGAINVRSYSDIEKFPLRVSPQIRSQFHQSRDFQSSQPEPFKNNRDSVIISGRINQEYYEKEQEIANIWGRVLELDTVNINESFNHLGGNSILAIKLLKEFESAYPGMIEIADIFTYNTIKELAEHLDKKIEARKLIVSHEVKQNEDQVFLDTLNELKNGALSVEESMKLLGLKGE